MSDLKFPKFESETEEAKWWFENDDLVFAEFVKAAREGRLHRGSALARLEGREGELLPPFNFCGEDDQG
jgi:hypothetical protein